MTHQPHLTLPGNHGTDPSRSHVEAHGEQSGDTGQHRSTKGEANLVAFCDQMIVSVNKTTATATAIICLDFCQTFGHGLPQHPSL